MGKGHGTAQRFILDHFAAAAGRRERRREAIPVGVLAHFYAGATGVRETAHLRASFRRAALSLIDKAKLQGGDYLVPTRLLEGGRATSRRWVFHVWPVEINDPKIHPASWILFM